MRKIDLSNMSSAISRLQSILSDTDHEISSKKNQFDIVSTSFCKEARVNLRQSKNLLHDFGLTVSISQIDYLLEMCNMSKKPSYDTFSYRLNTILSVIHSELQIKSVFSVDGVDVSYISPSDPLFGKGVDLAFPSASFDIQEAATCFGLGRDTAAVFHLMRSLEIGMRAVAASLGLPDPVGSGRNWGQMNGSIKAECDRRTAQNVWEKAEDRTFYSEVHASIDAVRAAWRNVTMHIEKRYTHDEAEQILAVTKGFMKKISERIDENGNSVS